MVLAILNPLVRPARRAGERDRNTAPRAAAARWLEYLLLGAVLCAVTLWALYPWRVYFFDGLANHWDPALMSEWMAWNAHNILKGHFLLPNFNANFFYPHSYTLAMSEPLWPESFIYAIPWALTGNPDLSFNVTLLFFWGLSGVCMFALTRELGLSRVAGYVAALAFCLLPHRLEYYVEFNMSLVFVVPLLYLAFIRWLRFLDVRHALLFVLAFWVSATSVIYYTLILVIPLVCLLFAWLAAHPGILRRRDFYLTLALIAGLSIGLAAIYLYPYAILRLKGGYVRSLSEQFEHAAQALTYLRPSGRSRAHEFLYLLIPSKREETALFPGIAVCLGALFYAWRARLLRRNQRPVVAALAGLRLAAWLGFWTLMLVGAFYGTTTAFGVVGPLATPALAAVLVLSVALVLLRAPATQTDVWLLGLGLGALVAFVMSLGPTLTVGPDSALETVGPSPLAFLYQDVPLFGAIRVTSRFSIIVLAFLIIAGCAAVDRLVRARPAIYGLWVALAAVLIAETWSWPYNFRDYSVLRESPVQQRLQRMRKPVTLFQMPAGPRLLEGSAVLSTAGRFHYTVNGLSGFITDEFIGLAREMTHADIRQATAWLAELWPDVYLVIDVREQAIWHVLRHMAFSEQSLGPDWQPVAHDRWFALYRLEHHPQHAAHIVRRLRTDVLHANPVLRFQARATRGKAAQPFQVSVNGQTVSQLSAGPTWEDFTVTIPADYPANLRGDTVALDALPGAADNTVATMPGWEVRNIGFSPRR